MPEENLERRRNKSHLRYGPRHSNLRTNKSRGHMARGGSSNDLLNENTDTIARSLKNMKLSSKKPPAKKPVIQLERSDSEEDNEDYSDVDTDTEVSPQQSLVAVDKDQPLLAQRAPLAPKVTSETVLSVSDVHTAAAQAAQGSFVDRSDLVSAAVSDMRSDDDLASIIGANSMRTQNMLSRQRQQRKRERAEVAPAPREKKDRLMERVFKQYFNCRAVQNPVMQSIRRVIPANEQQSSIPSLFYGSRRRRYSEAGSPLGYRNKNLTATTLTQIDGGNNDNTAFILEKLWTEGWNDPDKTPSVTPAGTPNASRRSSPDTRKSGIKLG